MPFFILRNIVSLFLVFSFISSIANVICSHGLFFNFPLDPFHRVTFLRNRHKDKVPQYSHPRCLIKNHLICVRLPKFLNGPKYNKGEVAGKVVAAVALWITASLSSAVLFKAHLSNLCNAKVAIFLLDKHLLCLSDWQLFSVSATVHCCCQTEHFFSHINLTSLLTAVLRDLRTRVGWSLHVIKPSKLKEGKGARVRESAPSGRVIRHSCFLLCTCFLC